mgnify:CR=1 FL=1
MCADGVELVEQRLVGREPLVGGLAPRADARPRAPSVRPLANDAVRLTATIRPPPAATGTRTSSTRCRMLAAQNGR